MLLFHGLNTVTSSTGYALASSSSPLYHNMSSSAPSSTASSPMTTPSHISHGGVSSFSSSSSSSSSSVGVVASPGFVAQTPTSFLQANHQHPSAVIAGGTTYYKHSIPPSPSPSSTSQYGSGTQYGGGTLGGGSLGSGRSLYNHNDMVNKQRKLEERMGPGHLPSHNLTHFLTHLHSLSRPP